ncbi:hypothetical protein VP01_3709g2 [Puccinia sorghi]|uniref:Uncharacterized protein n=1 Tax=Puccinia sorghi TaxID=27349 RepID=A0A0L6UU37_9BASI|nr:hypothetical protein VP01_3709g2 [Puccinia sorghi]
MYSQKFRLLSSLEHFLIKISSFWKTQLIQMINVNFNYHLEHSQVRIKHSIGILKGQSSSFCELWTQIRNFKEVRDTIKINGMSFVKKMSLIQLLWLRTTLTTKTMGYMAS